ncbi:MAG: DsrE family protein [Venatoribacter sp.]
MSSSSNIVVLFSHAPSQDLEAAELALALAAFDEPVKVILQGQGLQWLLPQAPLKAGGKAAHKVLAAFPLYEIELLISSQSQAWAETQQITIPAFVRVQNRVELNHLCSTAKHCFQF